MTTDNSTWPHSFKQFTLENWQVPDMPDYFPDISPEAWIQLMLDPKLSSQIPVEISAMYEVARGAMIEGWFYYPLLTLAREQLHRVEEAASRLRCAQLKITPWRIIKTGKRKGQLLPPNFSDLIAELAKHGDISEADVPRWNSTRWLRNHSSHPKRQSIYSPGMAYNGLNTTAELINRLFQPTA